MSEHTLLSSKIKELYPVPISDAEASDAAGRLISFFKILSDVHQQQSKEGYDDFRSKNTVDKTK